jgi:hypothetical protein
MGFMGFLLEVIGKAGGLLAGRSFRGISSRSGRH